MKFIAVVKPKPDIYHSRSMRANVVLNIDTKRDSDLMNNSEKTHQPIK